jgi:hypothetical protein
MPKNLTIVRDSDVTIPFTLTGVDLTGQTLFFTAKPASKLDTTDPSDSNAVIKASTTAHDNAAQGLSHISLTGTASAGANTTNVTPGEYD